MIEGLFLSHATFDLGTKITINCDQLKNPPFLTASGSFTISISHPSAATGVVSTGMQIRMATLPTLTKFLMEPLGRIAGTTGEYRITLSSGQPLNTGTVLKILFPKELNLPEAGLCSLVSNQIKKIVCILE
jgi:hypothetical protein